MGLPIIIYNIRNPDFLFYCLAQARHTNPDTRIILLGDETNAHYSFIEHVPIEDYSGEAKDVAAVYRHFSRNSHEMELRCVQRWFVTRDFMHAQGMERCFVMDSDVMLYCDITKEAAKFAHVDYTLSRMVSAGITFLNSVEVLESFCDYVYELYRDEARLKEWEKGFAEKGTSVNDMTLFRLFEKTNRHSVANTFEIIDNSLFDDNITSPQGFEFEGNLKKLYWQENEPYGKHLELNRLVKFNLLHFAGVHAKHVMRHLCNIKQVQNMQLSIPA